MSNPVPPTHTTGTPVSPAPAAHPAGAAAVTPTKRRSKTPGILAIVGGIVLSLLLAGAALVALSLALRPALSDAGANEYYYVTGNGMLDLDDNAKAVGVNEPGLSCTLADSAGQELPREKASYSAWSIPNPGTYQIHCEQGGEHKVPMFVVGGAKKDVVFDVNTHRAIDFGVPALILLGGIIASILAGRKLLRR